MEGQDLVPTDETARAVQEVSKLGQDVARLAESGGSWLSGILDELPKNLAGILGDRVKYFRYAQLLKLEQGRLDMLVKWNVPKDEQTTPSPVLAIPIFEASIDEDRRELQNLWERLLAAASDPKRKGRVRASFIELIKKLDPIDAILLQKTPEWTHNAQYVDFLKKTFQIDKDDTYLSIDNLISLELLHKAGSPSGYVTTALARVFLETVCKDS